MRKTVMASLACVAGALGFIVACDANAQTRINIDMSRTVGEVPALIYGAGAEDVNHEIYGGLYDQRIFGESMEEPAVSDVEGFVQYDSPWAVSGDVLGLHTGSHGKIVYQCPAMRKGRISTDVRLDGGSAIAGIIFNVSEASAGADAFVGYEISLDASRKTLVVGRHRHNWSSLANVPVEFDPKAWNTLAVDFDGAKAGISLNGKAVYELDDTAEPITGGMPGLRSYGGPASFRNFTVDGTAVAFRATESSARGFRQYDDKWTVSGGVLSTRAAHCAKIVSVCRDMAGGVANRSLDITVTRNDGGDRVVAHVVNTSSSVQRVKLAVSNAGEVLSTRMVSVSGNLGENNTPQNPGRIVPQETEITTTTITLKPNSYNMIEMQLAPTTGIGGVEKEASARDTYYYNVSGQRTAVRGHGIYVTDKGRKVAM